MPGFLGESSTIHSQPVLFPFFFFFQSGEKPNAMLKSLTPNAGVILTASFPEEADSVMASLKPPRDTPQPYIFQAFTRYSRLSHDIPGFHMIFQAFILSQKGRFQTIG